MRDSGGCRDASDRYRDAGAAEFEAIAVDLPRIIFWNALLERYLGVTRAELGAAAAGIAWDEGRRTGLEYAIALALDAESSLALPTSLG